MTGCVITVWLYRIKIFYVKACMGRFFILKTQLCWKIHIYADLSLFVILIGYMFLSAGLISAKRRQLM